MPKKRATSTTSKTSVKKKTATKKKSVAPKASTKTATATKRSTKKSVKKKTSRKVPEKQLTRADLPPELIAQITSELRAELRSEIDFKVQTAIAREREYLASITAPCRYRPYDEPESNLDERRRLPSQPERSRPQIKFVNEISDEFLRVEEERKRRWKDLKPQYDRGIELMEKYGKKIMNLPGVTGLHVGFKRKSNKITYPLQYALRISVMKKRDKNDPRISKLLPSEIHGYPTDILERKFESLTESMSAEKTYSAGAMGGPSGQPFNTAPVHPLNGGIVIAPKDRPGNWGTLGIILRNDYLIPFGITCAHVARKANTEVCHPANAESIGSVVYSTNYADRYQDLSFIKINDEFHCDTSKIIKTGMDGNDPVLTASMTPAEHWNVAFKIGAATNPEEVVRGRVQAVKARVKLSDGRDMVDQIIVTRDPGTSHPLVSPGDSGSVLLSLTEHDKIVHLIGLVHARTEDGEIVASHWSGVDAHFKEATKDIR
jgi:hypothetical protein